MQSKSVSQFHVESCKLFVMLITVQYVNINSKNTQAV